MNTIIFFLRYLFIFLLEIFAFIFLIKMLLPLKNLYKIGILNLTLILIYIALNLIYFGHILYGWRILLPYHYSMAAIICILILFRLINLNVEIKYKFYKNEKIFIYFNQRDKRWKNVGYRSSNIGKSGCGLAVLAMIHSGIGEETTIEKVRDSIYEISNTKEGYGTSIDSMVKYLNNADIENKYLPRGIELNSEIKENNVIIVWWQNLPKYINKIPLPHFGDSLMYCCMI